MINELNDPDLAMKIKQAALQLSGVLGLVIASFLAYAPVATAGIEALGIDPRGRDSELTKIYPYPPFRCYENDALENARPYPPHPADVAYEAAQAQSDASGALVDLAVFEVQAAKTD